MANRTITYTIYHPLTNLPWAGATLYARLVTEFTAGANTYPAETYTSTADANGAGSIVLAVPDSGTAHYEFSAPGLSRFTVFLASGPTTDLAVLLASPGSSVSQSAIQTAIDAHATVKASASVLGHIKVGGYLAISGDGTLSGAASMAFTVPVRAAYSTQVWTTMPAALTEFNANTQGRTKADLTNATQARLLVHMMSTAGASGAELRGQYSTDASAWNYLDGATGPAAAINVASTTVAGAWVNLVAGAKADVFIRVVGINGDGIISPSFGNISIQVR